MKVKEIIAVIQKESLKGGSVELTGSNGQKIIVPLQMKDSACMDAIIHVEKYLRKNIYEDPSIADCLNVLIDSYWWLQTLTLLFDKYTSVPGGQSNINIKFKEEEEAIK